jgi:uncharacterized repeat protein (TIGR04076 family)
MTAEAPEIVAGSQRVRVTVVRIDRPRSAMRVGDWFEIEGSRLFIPEGKSICPFALAAVAPVVLMGQIDLPADNWFVRKPYFCGPDAEENLVMKIEPVVAEACA